MFWTLLILVTGLLSGLAGFNMGGVPAGLFLGAIGILVTVGAHDVSRHKHAIFAGSLIAGLSAWWFAGMFVGVSCGLLAFLVLLALHDFLLKKDAVLPLGLATMLVCGGSAFYFLPGEVSSRGAVATVASIIGFLLWVGIYDHYLQRTHTIRRNFPIIGWCRYGLELIGDELRQYWFMSDSEERPYNRTTRQYLYRSGKGVDNNLGFGTKEDYRALGKMHLLHNGQAIPDDEMGNMLPRLIIGADCPKPYTPTWPLGISHMSWGAQSEEAVRAEASGALKADIHMGTGEGGYTPFHRDGVVKPVTLKQRLKYGTAIAKHCLVLGLSEKPQPPVREVIGGPKIILEIGSGGFGFHRLLKDAFTDAAGRKFRKLWSKDLDIDAVVAKVQDPDNHIQMGIIKKDQGAKVGAGGKLPKEKITPALADWRGIPEDEDCYSPNVWREWKTAAELCEFIAMLKTRTGIPWGTKLALGTTNFVEEVAAYKATTGRGPDLIIIDGGEGGTGAGPVSLADSVGLPLLHSLPVVDNILRKHGVRHNTVLVGAGQLAKGSDIMIAIAAGADMVDIGRGFLIAGLGCIMAQRCHTNRCPTGILTQDPRLRRGLDPMDKYVRVANYARVLQREMIMLCKSLGVRSPWELTRDNVSIVSAPGVSTPLSQLYPYPDDGKRHFQLAPPLEAPEETHNKRGPKLTKIGFEPGRPSSLP